MEYFKKKLCVDKGIYYVFHSLVYEVLFFCFNKFMYFILEIINKQKRDLILMCIMLLDSLLS